MEQSLTQVVAAQQPPLQGWLKPQLVVHVCVVPSQAWPIGQSPAWLQPTQVPPDEQTGVLAIVVQLTHAPPFGAHALLLIPVHVPHRCRTR
jgi:hypothetical protein